MTMRLRDGWAANNRPAGQDQAPIDAAEAPATLMNCRLVSPWLRPPADNRLLFFAIIAPFVRCGYFRRTLLSEETLEVNVPRSEILFLDKAMCERLHER